MSVVLQPSTRKNKKFEVILPDGTDGVSAYKSIHFGDSRYSDFTQHKDEERKNAYIIRHAKRENWEDPYTSGFWSRWLLWNKPTLVGSIRDIKKQFNIVVTPLLL